MTSDAKFRKSRDPREIELRRKFHVSSEISYFSEEKKAALENVIQFLEFLTVHNSCFRCLDKNQRRDREPWNIVKSDHVKKTDDSTGTRLSREIRRDEKANNKRDDSTNRRSGTIVEQLERRHSFDVPRASTNYAGAQNWIIDSRYQATESIARVLPSWSTFSSHPHPLSLSKTSPSGWINSSPHPRIYFRSLPWLRSRNFKRLMTDMTPRSSILLERQHVVVVVVVVVKFLTDQKMCQLIVFRNCSAFLP